MADCSSRHGQWQLHEWLGKEVSHNQRMALIFFTQTVFISLTHHFPSYLTLFPFRLWAPWDKSWVCAQPLPSAHLTWAHFTVEGFQVLPQNKWEGRLTVNIYQARRSKPAFECRLCKCLLFHSIPVLSLTLLSAEEWHQGCHQSSHWGL